MRRLVLLPALALTGCELLQGVATPGGESPQAPSAELASVALVEQPGYDRLAAYFCGDFAGGSAVGQAACTLAFGAAPAKADLKFGFDTVFQLHNPNSFPVPLVELLLAFNVFDGDQAAQLGTVCVSFCDPDSGDCGDPSQACRAPDKTVRDITDFVPTVDDLIRIANNLVNGDGLDDNLKFRVIPAREAQACREAGEDCAPGQADGKDALCCGGECTPVPDGCRPGRGPDGRWCALCAGSAEAHVRFELGIDPLLSILGTVAQRSADSLVAGERPDLDIPYRAEGTLFFDVPVLGRFALGFGPLASRWSLQE
jgi:hypothetical protein